MGLSNLFLVYKRLLVTILVAIVVIAFISIVAHTTGAPEPEGPDYDIPISNYPTSWVVYAPIYDENNELMDEIQGVDIVKATGGMSHEYLDYQHIQLPDGRVTGVFLYGMYRGGKPFRDRFFINEEQVVQIGPDFRPNDGILQGYSFVVDDEEGTYVLIYVDQDWVDIFGTTQYAVWSDNINDAESLQEKILEYEKMQNGLYFARVAGDFSWFFNPDHVTGRFFFGDLSREEYLSSEDLNDIQNTVIMMI